jgi:hypothetical protein
MRRRACLEPIRNAAYRVTTIAGHCSKSISVSQSTQAAFLRAGALALAAFFAAAFFAAGFFTAVLAALFALAVAALRAGALRARGGGVSSLLSSSAPACARASAAAVVVVVVFLAAPCPASCPGWPAAARPGRSRSSLGRLFVRIGHGDGLGLLGLDLLLDQRHHVFAVGVVVLLGFQSSLMPCTRAIAILQFLVLIGRLRVRSAGIFSSCRRGSRPGSAACS